jgi:hypothetical protein
MASRTRMCLVCKKLIEADRAADYDDTSLCAQHGREIERLGGEFKVLAEQENLAKENSLKKNRGGVKTKLVRNLAAINQLREEYLQRQAQ